MCKLCKLPDVVGSAVRCPAVGEAVCMYHCYEDCDYGTDDGRCRYNYDKRRPELMAKLTAAMPDNVNRIVWAHANLRKPDVARRYSEFKLRLGIPRYAPLSEEERALFDRMEVCISAKADSAGGHPADNNGAAGDGNI